MPGPQVPTSIKHGPFYSYRKNPFSVATLFGEKVGVIYFGGFCIEVRMVHDYEYMIVTMYNYHVSVAKIDLNPYHVCSHHLTG